jgi:hypothetical protein
MQSTRTSVLLCGSSIGSFWNLCSLASFSTKSGVLFQSHVQNISEFKTSCAACALIADRLEEASTDERLSNTSNISARLFVENYRGKPGRMVIDLEHPPFRPYRVLYPGGKGVAKASSISNELGRLAFWPCLGDPAAPYVYSVHSNLGNTDSAIFDLARSWLLDCQDNHTQCAPRHSDFSPSRCLEVTMANGINSLRFFQCNGPPWHMPL